ncbi:AlwI family type II restriction endonuclease [Patescibacteria group bacterium]|nr:AlwI family type II restriction endonuclease [Patescibacteria group bacterium]
MFTINRDRLTVISEKEGLVKSLLAQTWNLIGDDEYLDYLWNDSTPVLPSDNEEYLKEHLLATQKKERELATQIGAIPPVEATVPTNLLQLKQQSRVAEGNLLRLKEMEFYGRQSKPEQIDDILNFYDLIAHREILGGEAYYPAYLEWNTWRVFLAINTIANKPYEARGFKIDEDLQPVHHAPCNRPDMVFEYDDFLLVTEVTLSVRANQWSTEAEPVPRHVARIQSENEGKEVFGLFVAPQIDNNTVLTFFNNRQYSVGEKIIKLTIIPLTVDQLKTLLNLFKSKQFSVGKMKVLFGTIQSSMGASVDALAWYKGIPKIIGDWGTSL